MPKINGKSILNLKQFCAFLSAYSDTGDLTLQDFHRWIKKENDFARVIEARPSIAPILFSDEQWARGLITEWKVVFRIIEACPESASFLLPDGAPLRYSGRVDCEFSKFSLFYPVCYALLLKRDTLLEELRGKFSVAIGGSSWSVGISEEDDDAGLSDAKFDRCNHLHS